MSNKISIGLLSCHCASDIIIVITSCIHYLTLWLDAEVGALSQVARMGCLGALSQVARMVSQVVRRVW